MAPFVPLQLAAQSKYDHLMNEIETSDISCTGLVIRYGVFC